MLCLKKLIIGSGIFLPVLLSLLFVSPSYAIDDYSETVYQPSGLILQNCYDSCIKQYKYLIVTNDFNINNYFIAFKANFSNNGYSSYKSFYFSSVSTYNVIDISYIDSAFFTDGSFPPINVTFTLTNTLGESCSEPEEPEPCPVVPDTPYGDQLNNITMAIYTCGGILLVLYFFYCIYRIIIKNSGVSNL